MALAGRILILPKGNWNVETEYENLDLVYHGGTSWLAKKTSVGIEPTDDNAEYWQKLFDGDAFVETTIEAKVRAYMEQNG